MLASSHSILIDRAGYKSCIVPSYRGQGSCFVHIDSDDFGGIIFFWHFFASDILIGTGCQVKHFLLHVRNCVEVEMRCMYIY